MDQEATFAALIEEIEATPDGREAEEEWKPSRDVAHVLTALRLRLGLTQRELARRAGVSPAYISQLESGTANPSVRRLNAVLLVVGARLTLRAELPEQRVTKPRRRAG